MLAATSRGSGSNSGNCGHTRGDLEAVNLRLPELDRAHIVALLDNFEEVFASGTNPQ